MAGSEGREGVRLRTAGLSSSRLEAVTAALPDLLAGARARPVPSETASVGGFHLSTGPGVVRRRR